MKPLLNATEIQAIIPHRYPFQLIDTIISYGKGKELTAVKAVTIGEPYFSGHFPTMAIMPGALIIEALAQASAVLLELSNSNWEPGEQFINNQTDLIGVLGSVKVNMLRPVQPGCLLHLNVKLDWNRENASALKVAATVNDLLCAQGSIVVAMVNKNQFLSVVNS